MDLLHHEMLIAALLGSLCIPFDLNQFLLDLIAVQIIEGCLPCCKTSDLQITDIINISCIIQDCRYIRSHIAVALRHTDDHRTVLTCHIDLLRILLKHQSQCIRATNTNHCMIDRIHRGMLILLIVIIHQLHSHLGIGRRIKLISLLQKLHL